MTNAIESESATTARGDFETRSPVDIKLGLDKYVQGAEVLCFAYSLRGETPQLWRPGAPNPQDLFGHVLAGGSFAAWNVMFEYQVWNKVCVPRHGWPVLPIEQCVDTMAWAAAMNLPQALASCGSAIGLPLDLQKNKRGRYLIQRLCVPHPPTKTRSGMWVEEPALMQELYDYCVQDVVSEGAIAAKLRPLSTHEQSVWLATQRINLRGLPVDIEEIRATTRIVNAEKERLNGELAQITKHEVNAATNRGQLLAWVNARLPEALADLTGETVDDVLTRGDIPKDVRRALQIRSHVCQTSTAKHEVLLSTACDDGTVKGLLTYHGASTGRWASRGGLNAQNLPRPPLGEEDISSAHAVMGLGDHGFAVSMFGDRVMDAAVSTVRGVIKAPLGHEFIDADWSSVENRIGSWIAGQQDKVDMFASGLDEYKVFASKSLYQVHYNDVTKEQRQVSKSAVLGCMFGQGAVGLVSYAKKHGVDITEERSQEIVSAYRGEYPKVTSMWWRCGDAVLDAVRTPGVVIKVGEHVQISMMRGFMWMKLPSGRLISWSAPRIETLDTPWGEKRTGVTVMGVDRFTRQWVRQKLIGSSVYQSGVQATARDLMADALLRLEAAGYPVVLLVHDEFLSLVPEGQGSEKEFMEIMCQPPWWAGGLPLAAEAWRGIRFKK